MIIEGVWDYKNPSTFSKRDIFSGPPSFEIVGGAPFITGACVGVCLEGTDSFVSLSATSPCIHSVFYSVYGTRFFVDESELKLKVRLNKAILTSLQTRQKAVTHPLMSGDVIVFSGDGLKKYKGDQLTVSNIDSESTLVVASKKFKRLFLDATAEIYNNHRGGPVTCLLSAGTDSALTLWALKEIGADVIAVTAATAETEFDPSYSKKYAEDLKVLYYFVEVPSDPEKLFEVMTQVMLDIEMGEFSNVLMGICNKLIGDLSKKLGRYTLYHGYRADKLAGATLLGVNRYKKLLRESGQESTSENWRDYRVEFFLEHFQTAMHISRLSRRNKLDWRDIFLHKGVMDFVFKQPLAVCPTEMDKRLYKYALEGIFSRPSWDTNRKMGYYTGSGMGELRLKKGYEFLLKQNTEKIYTLVKNRFLNEAII